MLIQETQHLLKRLFLRILNLLILVLAHNSKT